MKCFNFATASLLILASSVMILAAPNVGVGHVQQGAKRNWFGPVQPGTTECVFDGRTDLKTGGFKELCTEQEQVCPYAELDITLS